MNYYRNQAFGTKICVLSVICLGIPDDRLYAERYTGFLKICSICC